jgi:DNA-binding Xre family transcriptional regulator
MKKNKPISTFDKEMQNPAFASAYREEYQEVVLSELLLALMDEDSMSVRQLAKEAGLSPTAIQKIRSGESQDMRLKNFVGVVQALGYNLVLERGDQRISFAPPPNPVRTLD